MITINTNIYKMFINEDMIGHLSYFLYNKKGKRNLSSIHVSIFDYAIFNKGFTETPIPYNVNIHSFYRFKK